VSFDFLPSEAEGPHIQGDIREHTYDGFDLIVAHPECTYLCSSGQHWNRRVAKRSEATAAALDIVRWVLNLPARRLCLENPIGIISTQIRKPDQIIQPYQYGDDASKATCLWLKGLHPLRPTALIPPRITWTNGKPAMRWSNQTDSGQNRSTPSETRWMERSRTYQGIAEAMADQWGAGA
jgi:hypothetical protein